MANFFQTQGATRPQSSDNFDSHKR